MVRKLMLRELVLLTLCSLRYQDLRLPLSDWRSFFVKLRKMPCCSGAVFVYFSLALNFQKLDQSFISLFWVAEPLMFRSLGVKNYMNSFLWFTKPVNFFVFLATVTRQRLIFQDFFFISYVLIPYCRAIRSKSSMERW